MPTDTNPYNREADYAPLDPAYQVPSNPRIQHSVGGYAPTLDVSYEGIPDATRVQAEPVHSPAVPATGVRAFFKRLFANKTERESVVNQTGTWNKALAEYDHAAPSPYLTPDYNVRPTTTQVHSFSVVRPMTGGTPDRLTGMHGSAATLQRDVHTGKRLYGLRPVSEAKPTTNISPVSNAVADSANYAQSANGEVSAPLDSYVLG